MVEYSYDADNRLVGTVHYNNKVSSSLIPNLDNETTAADVATYRPALDSTNDIWSWRVYDKDGRLIQTTDGDGSTTILTYDGEGKLTQTRSYYNKLNVATYKTIANDTPTAITAVTAPTANASLDAITRNFYDKDGRLVGTVDAELNVTQIK